MRTTFLAVLLLLTLGSAAQVKRSAPPIASPLERGSTSQRLEALVRISKMPPEQRDAETWSAVERETRRMLAFYRRHTAESESESELNGMYSAGLVQVLAQRRDPRLIPVFIEFCGMTRYAIDALIDFGDLAVPAMLKTVMAPDTDLKPKGGVSSALVALLHSDTTGQLSVSNRRKIEEYARGILDRDAELPSNELGSLADVALATGLPELRVEVERLATDRSAWERHGITAPTSIDLGQRILRAELSKTPQS